MRFIILILIMFISATARADEGKIKVPESDFARPLSSWFHPGKCAASPGKFIHVSVGNGEKTVLKIERGLYEVATPNNIDMEGKPKAPVNIVMPEETGCPGTPFNVARMLLKTPPGIDNASGLILTLPGKLHDEDLAKLRDSDGCAELKDEPGTVHCVGVQTVGGLKQPVEYIMAKDPKDLQKSGGPMRARCIYPARDKRVCTIQDSISGEAGYEAIMKAEPTLKNIRTLHEQVESYIKKAEVL
jgi:hypothetical protein